jgi:hypothetical protein
MMSDFIQQHPFIFWSLMMWLGSLGLVILLLCMRPMTAAFLRSLKDQKAETEKAPKGRYHEIQDAIRRSQA